MTGKTEAPGEGEGLDSEVVDVSGGASASSRPAVQADEGPGARGETQHALDENPGARSRAGFHHGLPGSLREVEDEPPIVARMVVEIRSDGSTTIARGAVEDRLGDQQVAVEAKADSPMALSLALAKLLFGAAGLRGSIGGGSGSESAGGRAVDEAPRSRLGRLRARLEQEIDERVGRELQRRLLGGLGKLGDKDEEP
ncbi:hypothetical protein G6O69_34865 [Pseudenhygromyxa sp. WMMC2535]|uniref:hypothetical protein n=1 Tax=Pseudenhygromyxa sp. WMMC2535 TaxID=2712867 RepID=UPI001552C442|nr:hypothetical protein [Pseudenhygromyxa sp. WMMC2535]NVB43057.1 hypothetical protein [Pseudenhygromyxa sp. WMMC2535]